MNTLSIDSNLIELIILSSQLVIFTFINKLGML